MSAEHQNFEIHQGNNKILAFEVLDPLGAVVNISTASIEWLLSDDRNGTTRITKSTIDGITITDGPNGLFEVTLDAADTNDLEGDFYHEATVIDGGSTMTVSTGIAKIVVTKRA